MNGPIEPNDVIISCSSGNAQNSAISIIRISGFVGRKIFAPHFSVSLAKIKPRMLVRTNLIFDDQILDDVMIVLFDSPGALLVRMFLKLAVMVTN